MGTTTGTSGTANGTIKAKDSLVIGQSSGGAEVHATLVRLTRYSAIFEVYSPSLILRTSEVINDFKIVLQDKTVYAGRAVVRNLVNAGSTLVCEVNLSENGWRDIDLNQVGSVSEYLNDQFSIFMREQQKVYKVVPDFKMAVADLQNILSDLRLWFEQVELNVRSQPSGTRDEFERKALQGLAHPVLSVLAPHFERFEHVSTTIDRDLRPVHDIYARRQLHPLVLCAPFMYRTFSKPLGYAGDYEMVNMMVRDPFQGGTTFAKILNTFFLNTPPVVAHRNRVDYLAESLYRESVRSRKLGRPVRVFTLGCGPAQEIQKFISTSPLAAQCEFTLLDMNEETLEHVRGVMTQLKSRYAPEIQMNYIKKSVHNLLKASASTASISPGQQFDFVYCAGLFDYLSDNVSRRLTSLMYDWVAPGGMVLVTNVEASNPSKGWMEFVVDWHLFYRNVRDMETLIPVQASAENARVFTEPSGYNIFLEIRKPENG